MKMDKNRQALLYLKKKTIAAHLDGDGILVNHLCAIALHNVYKWCKKGELSSIAPEDFIWVPTFALNWLVSVSMITEIFWAIEKMQHSIHDTNKASLGPVYMITRLIGESNYDNKLSQSHLSAFLILFVVVRSIFVSPASIF